ncbi:MAG: hypothetical protein OH354_01540 [Candidatus Parvarchaeota archaeon]|nr:hypothetical protein [Candidatus Jingweiarchaeum tengchongense]MCW1300084.1 hypothetical protein [Candidatus Jingweiarchaeum tengchongense]MCW1304438.1 hypothetical protein [Candidatus Jingweiarchaeum tengchongense]MCW1305605.1 hypothetical protein [Candidatus Jingweiarchaeum tengchongense]MCW1310986.1 hypothetical protein [Candidatus Jingweiarchaeum tengchongense]
MTLVSSGIPGLDELVYGGIERGSIVLVSGSCGAGKTIFGMQFIYEALNRGEKCAFISLEEPVERVRKYFSKFGYEINKFEKEKKLLILHIEPNEIASKIEFQTKKKKMLAVNIRQTPIFFSKEDKIDRIVIDSVSALESAFTEKKTYRLYIHELFKNLRSTGATCLVLTETYGKEDRYSRSGVEEFLADGVIVLYHFKHGNQRLRAIEIVKMRGSKHSNKIVPFNITENGIKVYPTEEVYTNL